MENSNRIKMENPFRLTKAVDLTDREIAELWVNLGDGETFESRTRPRSMMPMLILGGKGSGKTHLMRYYSYQVQKIRHCANIAIREVDQLPKEMVHDRSNGERITHAFDPAQPRVDRSGVHDGKRFATAFARS